jgi:hypothetical protein
MEYSVLNLSKSLVNLVKSELDGDFTKRKIINLIKNDHFGQLIISKTPRNYDKIKIIMASWLIANNGDNLTQNEITKIINNFYVISTEEYQDMDYTFNDCEGCNGAGEISCDECYGNGIIDCNECDSAGLIKCDECDGKKTKKVTCDECDGDGVISDENITCNTCNGNGMVDYECDECAGSGEVDCDNCSGRGDLECDNCSGHGGHNCEYCDDGTISSDDEYYKVRANRYLVFGKTLESKVDVPIELETFNDILFDSKNSEYVMSLMSDTYFSDDTVSDINKKYDMDDSFVIISGIKKLENTDIKL